MSSQPSDSKDSKDDPYMLGKKLRRLREVSPPFSLSSGLRLMQYQIHKNRSSQPDNTSYYHDTSIQPTYCGCVVPE